MAEENREYHSIEGFNRVIHERARLAIMAILVGEQQAEFTVLKKALSLSDGNLNAHLKVLEKSGYVTVLKEFVAKRPRTTYCATDQGRRAFRDYIDALERFLKEFSGETK
jgi:DNA-binding HxlR family transcriptional regulator